MAGRAADVSFVLGELTGAQGPWPGAALIDPSRMAMAGHSIGGAAAIAAMLADSRSLAGIQPHPTERDHRVAGRETREGCRDHLGA